MLGFLLDLYSFAIGVTFYAFLVKLLICLIIIFAIIGFVTTIRFIIKKRKEKKKKNEDPYEAWLHKKR